MRLNALTSLTLGVGSLLAVVQAAITGDELCTPYMCINGQRDSDKKLDTYTMSPPTGKTIPLDQFGYMAIGLGKSMIGSPMVIMWPNPDGSITLSQRIADSHTQPKVMQVDASHQANVVTPRSFSNSSTTQLSFTIPSPSSGNDNDTSIIWALSSQNPRSSSVSANIVIHDHMGAGDLFMLRSLSTGSNDNTDDSSTPTDGTQQTESGQEGDEGSGTSPDSGGDGGGASTALIAHVTCGALATLLFFPLGILTPRYARAFTRQRWWFPIHSIVNGLLGMGLTIAAFGIARASFSSPGDMGGLDTTHRQCGAALFVLVMVQVLIGIITHWLKYPFKRFERNGRTPINYLHVGLGLACVALGWVTVYEGLWNEWPIWSTTGEAGKGYKIGYGVAVGLAAAAYVLGLMLLPRQLRTEGAQRAAGAIGGGQKGNGSHRGAGGGGGPGGGGLVRGEKNTGNSNRSENRRDGARYDGLNSAESNGSFFGHSQSQSQLQRPVEMADLQRGRYS